MTLIENEKILSSDVDVTEPLNSFFLLQPRVLK